MDSPVATNIPVVLITGFGPFRSILNNPSWQVAKALKNYREWNCPIHIILEEVDVTYDHVSTKVPEYWLKYNPTLVIHIGVAADNNGTLPEDCRCVKTDAPEMLTTLLPIDVVCAKVERRTNLPVKVSGDAGRFLCEFIYYQSLFIDPKRTVFIHIPELDETFTIENLAETIQLIIYELLRCVDPLPCLNRDGNYLINTNVPKTTL
ncbi:unnamed protein product [Rotaria magnacalcarata]